MNSRWQALFHENEPPPTKGDDGDHEGDGGEGQWTWAPFGPGWAIVTTVCVVGLLTVAAVGLILLRGLAQGWFDVRGAVIVTTVVAYMGYVTARRLLRSGIDSLYIDGETVLRLRQSERRGEFVVLWDIRLANVDTISFKGGFLRRQVPSATVGGRGFIVREVRNGRASEATAGCLTFDGKYLFRHPRLFKRLTGLAEEKPQSDRERKALARARELASKATEEPSSLPPELAALNETVLNIVRVGFEGRLHRSYERLLRLYAGMLVVLGVAVFLTLRNFAPRINILAGVGLVLTPTVLFGSWRWVWPVARLPRGKLGHRLTRTGLDAGLVVTAPLMLIFPAFWLVVAVYLGLLVLSLATARFGAAGMRRVAIAGALVCAGCVAGATAYLGNWEVRGTRRVCAVRFCDSARTYLAPSPDGRALAVGYVSVFRKPGRIPGSFVAFRDSPLALVNGFFLAIFRGRLVRGWDLAETSIMFFPAQGGRATELHVATAYIQHLRWSGDSSRLAFVGCSQNAGFRLFVAKPAAHSLRELYASRSPLGLPRNAWSENGREIEVVAAGDSITTHAAVDVESGDVQVLSASTVADSSAAPQQKDRSRIRTAFAGAPNRQWFASSESVGNETRVTITRVEDRQPAASVVIPRDTPVALAWSPDSRRLAVTRTERTWVYDVKADRTVLVKTWRRRRWDDLAWSMDSRALYFTQYVTANIIGFEVVRVELPE